MGCGIGGELKHVVGDEMAAEALQYREAMAGHAGFKDHHFASFLIPELLSFPEL